MRSEPSPPRHARAAHGDWAYASHDLALGQVPYAKIVSFE
jgi:hypothetical protein